MGTESVRVLLADDHALVRAGLKAVLRTAKDITVVGEASTGREAVALAERTKPDVVVIDLATPDLNGIDATKEIVASEAASRVLVLTMHTEKEYVARALTAGASGYLVKSAADRQLVDAVRAVARGEIYLRPAADRFVARANQRSESAVGERARYERLTNRERTVLQLFAEGYSAPDIGERLFISPKTVDTYKQRINEKLGLTSRPDYVRFALKLGLLSAEGSPSS